MNPFNLLLAAAIITSFCILVSIVYVSTKIKEASHSVRLLDAEFPDMDDSVTKEAMNDFEDFYIRSTSDARLTMGLFYSDNEVETLRRKYSPLKLPKGRYKV